MINKNLMLVVAVVLLIGIAGSFFYFKNKSSNNQNNQPVNPTTQTEVTPLPTAQATLTPSGSPSASASPKAISEAAVSLTAQGFSPATLNITAGTRVIWTNNSGAPAAVNSDPHPIHTLWPFLNLGQFINNGTLSVVFDKPGTYTYHNHLNSSQKGTVIVK